MLFADDELKLELYGGKAYLLHYMYHIGFSVPEFITLNANDTKKIFGSVLNQIKPLFKGDISEDELLIRCEKAKNLILNFQFSEDHVAVINKKCLEKFGPNYRVSVRSSAISEDSKNASFAGQHDTLLYIKEDQLIDAIKKCMASAYNFNAMSYRRINQVPLDQMDFAIIIQKMIDASRSGVSFSMNTQGNLADCVIVAGYGSGEGVVMDKADTDMFFVNRGSESIRRQIKVKKIALFYDGTTLKEEPVELALQDKPVMDDEEILDINAFVLGLEKILGSPVDVEFSYDIDKKVYLLQVRPITTLNIDNIHVLDNTNIVESYPGITSPLSFSFATTMYERLFRRSAKAFWVSADNFDMSREIFGNLITHFYGRVYYRLDNWYKMMALVYNSKSSLKAWEDAVGLPDSAVGNYSFSLTGKIKTVLSVAWLIINYKKGNKRFFKAFDKAYMHFKAYGQHTQSAADLDEHLEACLYEGLANWHLTIVNDYLAFKTFGWLKNLIKTLKISDSDDFANELICAYGEVESELAVMQLLDIKDYVSQHTEIRQLFEQDNQSVLRAIENNAYPEFNKLWNGYLERFGDRTLAELKLETPSPRRHPELFVQLIRTQLGNELHSKGFRDNQLKIRQAAEEKLNAKIKWYDPRKIVFNWVRNMAAYGLMSRENMRFCRTRMYSAVKDIYMEFGKKMQTHGCIESENDVFWLQTGEVKEFTFNPDLKLCNTFKSLIKERKEQYAYYEQLITPDRIIYAVGEMPEPFHFEKRDASMNADAWTAMDYSSGELSGTAVSKGVAEGEALILLEPVLNADVRGKILVCKMTDPGWVFLMSQAKALVSEKGSLLSHTAIVGRELGIPVVVGVTDACSKIKNGDKIVVDGSKGTVVWDK